MACFMVPATEAIVTTVMTKVVEKKEKKTMEKDPQQIFVGESTHVSFSHKLKWLDWMLWGGSALLAFDSGEQRGGTECHVSGDGNHRSRYGCAGNPCLGRHGGSYQILGETSPWQKSVAKNIQTRKRGEIRYDIAMLYSGGCYYHRSLVSLPSA